MIDSFRGPYFFLSNFYDKPFVMSKESDLFNIFDSNYLVKSAEHAYQSRKATNADDFGLILSANTPREAKEIANKIELRNDWENIKLREMENVLWAKFDSIEMRKKLIETYPHDLIEGNTWGDKFWGIDLKTYLGENHLGKLLMRLRDVFIKEEL